MKALADVLFSSYFFPFEVTSVLLIVAAIGVMLLGRRHGDRPPVERTPRAAGTEAPPSPRRELEPVP